MLREARREFESVLTAALADAGWPTETLALEDPPEDVEAIVASSVAFRLANEAGEAPGAVAAQLVEAIELDDARYIDAVTQAGPYLNVLPSDAFYRDTLEAASSPEFGQLADRGESVVVEHTSANPTGPVHVGRARNPIIGDSLARLLDAAGYDVEVHYYVNDAGRQMAVFTWAYETFDESDLDQPPERDRIEYDLVRYYRKGNAFLEAASEEAVAEAEAEIQSIMQGMESGDEATFERVGEVVDQVLGGMRECLERLPATFDAFIKETQFMRDGSTDAVVDRLRESDQAHTADGAWQLDLDEWGIEKEFVFLRSDGTTLYTTRDLAHHEWKFDHFDRAITVLGEDQELHARQLEAALDILGNDTDRLESIHYSWVNLPEGTMSTRKGTGIDLDDLLDEAIDRARAEVERRLDDRTREGELDDATIDEIARSVGIGAVRYDIVATQPSKSITFEWEYALDFEAQSAPFVQYVHARCCGILEQADAESVAVPPGMPEHPAERALCERLAEFPWTIETAASERSPHRIATYLQDLADTFNAFYRDCPVLDATGEQRDRRIALVAATRQTVADGLGLLGVDAPDVM